MGVRVPPFAPLPALFACFCLLCTAILAIRLQSTVVDGAWAQTSGLEGVHINLVYRVASGISPYHDLSTDATSAIYNVGFYAVYGALAGVLGMSPSGLLGLRVVTLLAGAAPAAALVAVAGQEQPHSSRARRTAIAVVAIITPFTGWWLLTVRPDMLAVAFELTGFALIRASGRWRSPARALGAGAAFAAAFLMKQNAVGVLGAILVFLAVRREWKPALLIAALPLACLPAAALVGGPHFVQHTWFAPASTAFEAASWYRLLGEVAMTGGAAFIGLAAVTPRAALRRIDAVPIWLPVAVVVVLALPQLARVGAGRNYLIGAVALASVATWSGALGHTLAGPARRRLLQAAVVAHVALALLYLLPLGIGTLRLPSSGEAVQRAYAAVAGEPAPPTLADTPWTWLPWTVGVATEIPDPSIYPYLQARGLVTATVDSRLAACRYGTLLLRDPVLIARAERAGYGLRGTLPDGVSWLVRQRCARLDSSPLSSEPQFP
ncbi:MAG: hypothetical protein AB7P99_15600 [Vicinamibacterales bacterium]